MRALADQLIDGEETILRTEDAAKVEPDVDPSSLTPDERIALIVRYPELMQRPIVQLGDQAKIGRPPESVLELFKELKRIKAEKSRLLVGSRLLRNCSQIRHWQAQFPLCLPLAWHFLTRR